MQLVMERLLPFLGWGLTFLFMGLAMVCLSYGNLTGGAGFAVLAIAVCPHSPLPQWWRLRLLALGIVLT